ncbi:hypothetical protein B566_EDAN016307 [Ephemera danica]|nr:hypothetical protein B566_EDAN016307 [Ephemera danica]
MQQAHIPFKRPVLFSPFSYFCPLHCTNNGRLLLVHNLLYLLHFFCTSVATSSQCPSHCNFIIISEQYLIIYITNNSILMICVYIVYLKYHSFKLQI